MERIKSICCWLVAFFIFRLETKELVWFCFFHIYGLLALCYVDFYVYDPLEKTYWGAYRTLQNV